MEIIEKSIPSSKFDDVNLEGTTFNNINLKNSIFTDINFENTKISNVNMANVELSDCNLSGMTIEGILVLDMFEAYNKLRESDFTENRYRDFLIPLPQSPRKITE
ncbi:MAG: pentapeptide repeat-containing protein [Ignavibacteria bacterium]|nr:pentapeptide repeat-containing protein [Ignavibacteria bacterium]